MERDTSAPSSKASAILQSWWFCLAIASTVLILDQWTKCLVVRHWPQHTTNRVVIPNFLHFVHLRNTGGAWGILQGYSVVLSIVSFVVMAVLIVCFKSMIEGRSERAVSLALILGGIAGNLGDRLFREGQVVDFILVFYRSFHWPAFNVADSAITCGVTVFIISSFLRPHDGTSTDKD